MFGKIRPNEITDNETMNASVLITAAGSIVAQGIIKSLKLANQAGKPVKYRIIATDMSVQAAGLYRCDKGILVPPYSSPNYIDSVIKIVKEENIQAIYIGSDQELLVIGNAAEYIERETGAKVLSNPLEIINIARDKWKTFEFLKANNLPYALSSLPEDSDKFIHKIGFPLVVKPREGYGSLHFYVVNNLEEMNHAIYRIGKVGWNPVLQEYLEGDDVEFTSGVTVDRLGKYVMSSISIQKVIKNGQTYKAFIDDFKRIRGSSEETALKLGARGAINIQAKLEGEEPKIFEINPRFSATTPMRSAAGVNEPDIVFRNNILGEEIKIEHYERLISMRYWNEVYINYSTYEKTLNAGRINGINSFIHNYF
jgi:carbamoyl-phosphate synthase large subunit